MGLGSLRFLPRFKTNKKVKNTAEVRMHLGSIFVVRILRIHFFFYKIKIVNRIKYEQNVNSGDNEAKPRPR